MDYTPCYHYPLYCQQYYSYYYLHFKHRDEQEDDLLRVSIAVRLTILHVLKLFICVLLLILAVDDVVVVVVVITTSVKVYLYWVDVNSVDYSASFFESSVYNLVRHSEKEV